MQKRASGSFASRKALEGCQTAFLATKVPVRSGSTKRNTRAQSSLARQMDDFLAYHHLRHDEVEAANDRPAWTFKKVYSPIY